MSLFTFTSAVANNGSATANAETYFLIFVIDDNIFNGKLWLFVMSYFFSLFFDELDCRRVDCKH